MHLYRSGEERLDVKEAYDLLLGELKHHYNGWKTRKSPLCIACILDVKCVSQVSVPCAEIELPFYSSEKIKMMVTGASGKNDESFANIYK